MGQALKQVILFYTYIMHIFILYCTVFIVLYSALLIVIAIVIKAYYKTVYKLFNAFLYHTTLNLCYLSL